MSMSIARLRPTFILCLISLISWLWLTTAVVAQGLPPEASQISLLPDAIAARSRFDSSNIPSEKVNQFVHACLQVVALIERREGELQGAETESESVRVEQEIEAEALAIIEQAGLTRQEYLQLLGLANTDPEFGERIAIQLQEATN
jgi:hypothetical protein